MQHLATGLAVSLTMAHRHTEDDRRRADAWRRLHARDDAMPDSHATTHQVRRRGLAAALVGRLHVALGGG